MIEDFKLPVESLRWTCDPTELEFNSTDAIPRLEEFIGQERALKAIEFGLTVDKTGYNIFVTGLSGSGRMSAIRAFLQKLVATDQEIKPPVVEDWCYVYNFADPDRPEIINLPKGKGKVLRARLDELLARLKAEITKAFSSEEYEARKKQVVEEGQSAHRQILQQLEKEAVDEGFTLQVSQMGVLLVPILDGKPATQEAFSALADNAKADIETRRSEFMNRVGEAFQRAHTLQREVEEKMRTLDQKVVEFTISRPFNMLRAELGGHPQVLSYLDSVRAFTMENIDRFRPSEEPPQPQGLPFPIAAPKERDSFLAFQVNVFVDNSATEGPPIVIETNPTYANLFGKIERRAHMGAYFTDHTMLKPGSMALANGGYLVLNAKDVLLSPGVWETLKRVIRHKKLRLEDPLEQLGYAMTPQGLRPQGIPVNTKVIMVGDNSLYQLLSANDEDFWEVFKVKADFDTQIDRTPENVRAYASFVATCCQKDDLIHFDSAGVAKVVEFGARQVEDRTRLSSRFGQVRNLLIEADFWAREWKSPIITAEHVRKAVAERINRSNLVQERMHKMIADGTIMVDVEGAVVGQVNGLAVYDLGDIAFGKPSRITARTYVGRSGVVNIERESQLSGKTHDKGVLILTGFLGARFAQDKPLTLSTSLCFEQSYSGIDGDSASSTELYAILSSLSGIPLKQSLAVTGSVNQRGEIQPIGGVNEKVEGFFDVCKAKGLTGEQGVMIPHTNVKNLMLREDVVEAAAEGAFHIYSVKTIDEGIELLTGVPAGERNEDGAFPEGTINFLVDRRLREISDSLKGSEDKKEKEKEAV